MGPWWIAAQAVMACSATARFGMNKISCVTVDVEAHIASVEPDDGVWLRGCVVHQHLRFLDDFGGGRNLISADFVESNNYGGVNGARDVEEGAGNALYAHDAAFIKFRCGHGVGRVLHIGPIRRCDPLVGRVFRTHGYGVLEVLQGFADKVGHGDVDVFFQVVPIDSKSTVIAARWFNGDGLILPECIDEVGGVVRVKEFDSKVIYSEGEGGR